MKGKGRILNHNLVSHSIVALWLAASGRVGDRRCIADLDSRSQSLHDLKMGATQILMTHDLGRSDHLAATEALTYCLQNSSSG